MGDKSRKPPQPATSRTITVQIPSNRNLAPAGSKNALPKGQVSIVVNVSPARSKTSQFSWDDEDALKEKNITKAVRKFSGHQALQSAMYSSMGVRRKSGVGEFPSFEGKTSKTVLERNTETSEEKTEHFHIKAVDVPLKKTVHDFTDAVNKIDEVQPLSAETFRELIQPLSEKRMEYHKIRDQIKQQKKKVEEIPFSKRCKNFLSHVNHFIEVITPFRNTLAWIDSHYGSDVYSYFVFIIWIVTLNIFSFGMTFCFALAPSIFYHDLNHGAAAFSVSKRPYEPMDFLTGDGYLAMSAFHYGFYLSDKSRILDGTSYDRSMGYVLALGAFYFVQLIVITYSLTGSYGRLMEVITMGGKQHYCDTVFFLWEHSSHHPDQIDQAKSQVMTQLREMLAVHHRQDHFSPIVYLKRIVINLGVLGLVGGICAGLWYTFKEQQIEKLSASVVGFENQKAVLPILVITIVNFFLPFLFSAITRREHSASYETELSLSLIKGITLNLGTLGVLFFYWIIEESGQVVNKSIFSAAVKDCNTPRPGCWETKLSMKFYQLAIMNMIFEWVFFVIGVSMIWIQQRCHPNSRWQLTFRADLLTQRALYLQILTWMGMYYSPLICLLALVSMIFSFTRDYLIVTHTRIYKSAPLGSGNESTQVAYTSALLLCFIICSAVVAFAVSLMMPSTDCGPLRTLCPAPDLVVAFVDRFKLDSPMLFHILDLLLTPSILLWFILFLIVFIYYFRVKARALDELLPILQNHLAMEGRDVTQYYLQLLRFEDRERRKGGKSPIR